MADVVSISQAVLTAREAVLEQHFAAQNSGDVEGVIASFERPRIEMIASGRVVEGEDAVRALLLDRRRGFPDQSFELVAIHQAERAATVEFWMSGTHLGPLHDVEPSGRRFRVRMAAIFDFDGSALIGLRLYYDAGAIARQIA